MLARVAHDIAQPVDAVAVYQAHRAGVEIGPDRLRAMALGDAGEVFGNLVERGVPRQWRERVAPAALGAGAPQRRQQSVGVVHAFGIARDLGADDAGGVRVRRGAAHAPDCSGIEALDLQRAGRRTVVRARRMVHIDAPRRSAAISHLWLVKRHRRSPRSRAGRRLTAPDAVRRL